MRTLLTLAALVTLALTACACEKTIHEARTPTGQPTATLVVSAQR